MVTDSTSHTVRNKKWASFFCELSGWLVQLPSASHFGLTLIFRYRPVGIRLQNAWLNSTGKRRDWELDCWEKILKICSRYGFKHPLPLQMVKL